MKSVKAIVYGVLGLFLTIGLGLLIGGVVWVMHTAENGGDWMGPVVLTLFGLGFTVQSVRFGLLPFLRGEKETAARERALEQVRLYGTRVVATVDRVAQTSRGWELLAIHTDPATGREAHFVHRYGFEPTNPPAVGSPIDVLYDPADPSIHVVEVY
ncbi:MAG: hypothetical protein QM809_10370 [Gordonia sp. (in: high G+C Gram-positive bacteria)]|uniref:hypothetical protein n=1 Tax=Gordonia sp. (in: high G+C Gram-positive bacteria) TaxID=84139 RepID=UPI0039E68AAA